jgi:hypothetical protein
MLHPLELIEFPELAQESLKLVHQWEAKHEM